VTAVRGVDFTIEPGAFVAFVGPSGSGKSTLLNMIGCLERPTAGQLTVLGRDVATLDRREAAGFRGRHIGFIFQDFNLVPVLTVRENIEYPLVMVQSRPVAERWARVDALLEAVGMGGQAVVELLRQEDWVKVGVAGHPRVAWIYAPLIGERERLAAEEH